MFRKLIPNKSWLLCFSPAVMLGTFLVEYLLAIYVLIRYRDLPVGRVAGLTLLMLGTFQLAEYQICLTDSQNWALPGLITITLMPPLGIHLIAQFTKRYWSAIIAYLVAGIFLFLPVVSDTILEGATCGGNYVILHLQDSYGYAYGVFYFGFLLIGLWQAAQALRQSKLGAQDRESLLWVIIGYLSFMVPMGIIYLLSPESHQAIPSIMCGFAVLFALILTFKVLPPQLAKHK